MENAKTLFQTKPWMMRVTRLIILVLLLAATAGCSSTEQKVLDHTLTEPLGDVTTAKFEINPDNGNLTVDGLTGGEPLLAGGTLQYLESQGIPYRSLTTITDQANLVWSANKAKASGFRFPWEACITKTDWLVHLNPNVAYEVNARSGGGNVKLDFAGLTITSLIAETGGGNVEVVLPENAADLSTTAKTGAGDVIVKIGSGTTGSNTVIAGSGAGNVLVRLPEKMAARVQMSSGMGKAIVASTFNKIDDKTYQSAGYESAVDKVQITLNSGAGNVTIETY